VLLFAGLDDDRNYPRLMRGEDGTMFDGGRDAMSFKWQILINGMEQSKTFEISYRYVRRLSDRKASLVKIASRKGKKIEDR